MVLRLLVVALALAAGCQRGIGDSCKTNAECSALGDRFCDTSVRGLFDPNDGRELVPGGYCTVEGCDVRLDTNQEPVDSCPGGAVCVRFFLPRQQRCNVPPDGCACGPGDRCVCDCPDRDGRCLPSFVLPGSDGGVTCRGGGEPPRTSACVGGGASPDGGADGGLGADAGAEPRPSVATVGRCAAEASERRWCMRKCNSDGDCREPRCSSSQLRPCFECRAFGEGNGAEPVPLPPWGKRPADPPKFCVQRGG